jgi:hypothetical protein
LKTAILDEFFQEFEVGESLPKDMKWHFSYWFNFTKIEEGHTHIDIHLEHEFYNTENDEVWVSLAIKNLFSVKGHLKTDEQKMFLLAVLFDNSIGNQQGIYAVKVPKSPLNQFLPPTVDLYTEEEAVLKNISNDWK